MKIDKKNIADRFAHLVLGKFLASLQPPDSESIRDHPEVGFIHSRIWTFESYIQPQILSWINWLSTSNEQTNFTYDITSLNEKHLAGFIHAITGRDIDECLNYFTELKEDKALKDHLKIKTENSNFHQFADIGGGYGRRIGWYAFVRIMKPKLVVETGVDKGLGSCVIAAALMKNSVEGSPGRYIGTDINPNAGYLFEKPYSDFGKVIYGDSIESLSKLNGPVDMFINDSDHSAAYEASEYHTVHKKLSAGAIVLSDNSHASSSLFDYSKQMGRRFLIFSEKPKDHFYPGASIGASF